MAIRKSFSKTSKTKIRFSPKDADKILEQEFMDDRGNIFKTIIDITPHSPRTPIIEWNVKYNDKKEKEESE